MSTAFLYGDLDTIVYMEYPQLTLEAEKEPKVCLLRKSLYGLKQSPRMWNQKIDEFLRSIFLNILFRKNVQCGSRALQCWERQIRHCYMLLSTLFGQI